MTNEFSEKLEIAAAKATQHMCGDLDVYQSKDKVFVDMFGPVLIIFNKKDNTVEISVAAEDQIAETIQPKEMS